MKGFEIARGTDGTLGSGREKIPEPAHPELDVRKMWEESKGLSAYTEKFPGMDCTVADLI